MGLEVLEVLFWVRGEGPGGKSNLTHIINTPCCNANATVVKVRSGRDAHVDSMSHYFLSVEQTIAQCAQSAGVSSSNDFEHRAADLSRHGAFG